MPTQQPRSPRRSKASLEALLLRSKGREAPAPSSKTVAPTEATLRQLHGPTREEQEEALVQKMQTLSNLLGMVDAALDDCASTRPPSSRPPASRTGLSTGASIGTPQSGKRTPGTAQSRAPALPATGEDGAVPPGSSSSSSSCRAQPHSGRAAGDSIPQVLHIGSRPAPDDNMPAKKPVVEHVQYTGQEHMLGGIKTRRKVDARATRSEMSSILGGD